MSTRVIHLIGICLSYGTCVHDSVSDLNSRVILSVNIKVPKYYLMGPSFDDRKILPLLSIVSRKVWLLSS